MEPNFAHNRPASKISRSNIVDIDKRFNYHTQIRRSKRSENTLLNRQNIQSSLLASIHEELSSSLPPALESYLMNSEQPLAAIIANRCIFFNIAHFNLVFQTLIQDFRVPATLHYLSLLTENDKFAEVVPKDILDKVIQKLYQLIRQYNQGNKQEELLDLIWIILGRACRTTREKQYSYVTALINHNRELKLTKPLIHLYYMLRKNWTTIAKETTLLRLVATIDPDNESSVQVRLSQIARAYICYYQYTHDQLLTIYNKISHIIINSSQYNKDTVNNAYNTLYTIVRQNNDTSPHNIRLILSSPLFQHIVDRMVKGAGETQRQCILYIFCSIFQMGEEGQRRKMIRAKSKGKMFVAEELVMGLVSGNNNIVLECLKAILLAMNAGLEEYFEGMEVRGKLESIIAFCEDGAIVEKAQELMRYLK